MKSGIVIEQEVHVGTATFLVVVMKFGNIYSHLVLDVAGQVVENEPFYDHIFNMINEFDKLKACP